MADYKYAYNGPEEGTAKAMLKGEAISTKTSIEMSKHLRGKTSAAAKALLERIIAHKEALPYTRFTDGLGHKQGSMAAGRYPEKAAAAFLRLIEVAEANANQKGLSSELQIVHLLAHKASRPFHYGRLRRRQVKATHVEIVLKEVAEKKAKKAAPKTAPKATETKATKESQPTPKVAETKAPEETPAAKESQPTKETAQQ